jgi:hypothetical protein
MRSFSYIRIFSHNKSQKVYFKFVHVLEYEIDLILVDMGDFVQSWHNKDANVILKLVISII